MYRRRRSNWRRAGAFSFASLVVALLVGAFSSVALAAPVNTAVPTISPTTPSVGTSMTATSGTWTSEAPAHWLEEGAALKEGEKTSVTVNGTMIHYAGTIAGVYGELDCYTTMTGGSLENPSGGGNGTGNFEIAYPECYAAEGWSKCAVTPGAAAPVKVDLTIDGKVKLSPTGAYLGTFTLSGKECPLAELNIKVTGVIEGRFKNIYPRIEFNPETSFTGALRFQSKAGPKASATGAIDFESGAGKEIGTDALVYTYQWKRCTGESCTEIGSPSKLPYYTATAADWGKTLKVTVTASDANGSASSTSAATSAVTGTPNWYVDKSGWQKITSAPFTSSNVLESEEAQAYNIGFTWGGTWFQIYCTGGSGSGTMTNTATQGKLEEYKLTLTGCSMLGPGSCQLTSSELKFNTMTATSAAGPTTSRKLTFAPVGVDVVNFSFKECGGLEGPYRFVGSFPGIFENSGSYVSHAYNEVKSAGTLKFQSSSGPVVSFEGVQRLLSEGNAVKLDAGA